MKTKTDKCTLPMVNRSTAGTYKVKPENEVKLINFLKEQNGK
jgi:hypothetical protein